MKKKKNRKFQIALLTILVLATFALVVRQKKGTIKKELRDFAIQDTSMVNKIFLADKEGGHVLLEEKNGYWTVNNNYEARQDLVDILLKTLLRIKVKEPVPKSAQENIIKSLAVKSIKVEIYQKGKLTKTFYVGGPTQDSYGTYMILENSSVPFVMEIPGFRGYLSSRFATSELEWRTQKVYNYQYNDIAKIKTVNHKLPNKSFIIQKTEDEIKLFTFPGGNPVSDFDTVKVKFYIAQFKNKSFSKYIDDVPMEWQDSIKQSQPMYEIEVTNTEGETKQVKAFNKPGWGRLNDFGEVLENDPDNFFMLLDNGDFVYSQYFVFDPVFKGINYFKKEE